MVDYVRPRPVGGNLHVARISTHCDFLEGGEVCSVKYEDSPPPKVRDPHVRPIRRNRNPVQMMMFWTGVVRIDVTGLQIDHGDGSRSRIVVMCDEESRSIWGDSDLTRFG